MTIRAVDPVEDDKDIIEEIWFLIVIIVVSVLILSIFLIWAVKTKCCKQPCLTKKHADIHPAPTSMSTPANANANTTEMALDGP